MSADLGACWQVKGLLEALKTTTQEMDTRFQSSIDQDLSSLKELETAVRAAVDGLSERVTGLETGCGKQDNRLASCVRSGLFHIRLSLLARACADII